MTTHVLHELEERLRESDEESRTERALRLADLLLIGQPEDGCMLFGGTESMNALLEARSSYIEGLYLAAILTAQICIEKLLSAAIELESSASRDMSYAHLLSEALARGWLGEYEYNLFDRLRQLRNPYAHHRSVRHHKSLERRAIDSGETTEDLLKCDARAMVGALLHLVNQPAFALGPIVVPFEEEDVLPPVHPDQASLPIDESEQ
jgi:hypothetical protein